MWRQICRLQLLSPQPSVPWDTGLHTHTTAGGQNQREHQPSAMDPLFCLHLIVCLLLSLMLNLVSVRVVYFFSLLGVNQEFLDYKESYCFYCETYTWTLNNYCVDCVCVSSGQLRAFTYPC
ncbi:hypothetical protein AMECASPLE_000759 [Ameca splendens]|uniref:Uncharacterized protein n=1 Tax=Ameca splendens TaxID=208324 RepID=A0ABV0Z6Z8_9TELE